MSDNEPKTFRGSMNDWAEASQRSGQKDYGATLLENDAVKLAGQQKLVELGLPILKHVALPLEDFLVASEKYFEKIGSQVFQISLRSEIADKRRLRAFPLNRAQTLDYIAQNIDPTEKSKFTIFLREFYPNLYGGNIVVDKHGDMVLEAVRGDQIDAVLGKGKIVAFGYRDPFLRRFSVYSDPKQTTELGDHKLKMVLLETMKAIPNDNVGANGEINPHPGYYEFVIVSGGKRKLQPFFIDYRDRAIYQFRSPIDNFT